MNEKDTRSKTCINFKLAPFDSDPFSQWVQLFPLQISFRIGHIKGLLHHGTPPFHS